jgi:hypothetical protein
VLAPGLNALLAEARVLKSQAFAVSTKASYRTHFMTFVRFCIFYGVKPVPALQSTIACYIAHLARTMAPVSVNIYLNIIRILHEESGLRNPLLDNYELAMIKRGLKRMKGAPPKQKAPMTVDILLKLYSTLDLRLASERAFWFAVLVGFFGYLRKSSLFPSSPAVKPLKRLCRRDVSRLCLGSFVLVCNHSKTNQSNERVHEVAFAACRDRRLCPVFAMLAHLGSGGRESESPLFNYVHAGVDLFFAHSAFVKHLKTGITRCGLDAGSISAHSLRRGGATLSFAAGISTEHIKARGDWVSEAYLKYIVVDAAAQLNVAQSFLRLRVLSKTCHV